MGGSSLPGQSSLLQTHWLFRQMLVEREARVMGGLQRQASMNGFGEDIATPQPPRRGMGPESHPNQRGASGGDGAPSGATEESWRQR